MVPGKGKSFPSLTSGALERQKLLSKGLGFATTLVVLVESWPGLEFFSFQEI